MIQKMNVIKRGNAPVSAMSPADAGAFSRVEPYGASVESARCLVVDGKYYPLLPGCPDDGLPLWTEAGVEAKEIALDAAIQALPAEVVAERFPNHLPWAVRLTKREADDAEADARAAQAKAEREAKEAQQATADERRAIAEADAVSKSDADAKAKDDAVLAAVEASDTKATKVAAAAQAAVDAADALAVAQAKRAAADAAKAAHEART